MTKKNYVLQVILIGLNLGHQQISIRLDHYILNLSFKAKLSNLVIFLVLLLCKLLSR